MIFCINFGLHIFSSWTITHSIISLCQKIISKIFPNTPPESFWTSEINQWQPKFMWTVNFFTGYTFGRFPGFIPNFIRLVRDR